MSKLFDIKIIENAEDVNPERVLIGGDPEFFCVDEDGNPRVPESLLGTIDKHRGLDIGDGCILFLDGPALEMSLPPQDSFYEIAKLFNKKVREVEEKILKNEGLYVTKYSTVNFDEDYMKTIPEDVWKIGCNPARIIRLTGFDPLCYRVYQHELPEMTTERYAGGHVHFGWTKDRDLESDTMHLLACCFFVSNIAPLFTYGRVIERYKEAILKRGKVYGNSSLCRFKPYGVEVRHYPNYIWFSSAFARAFDNKLKTKGINVND